jgi:hypothetical protein
VLYELLYTERGDASEALDKEYRYLTTDLMFKDITARYVILLLLPTDRRIIAELQVSARA